MKDNGMTYREIAREMGISFGRVRQILSDDTEGTEPTS
jgi:transcriptional regulator with XRE-family HTH domain